MTIIIPSIKGLRNFPPNTVNYANMDILITFVKYIKLILYSAYIYEIKLRVHVNLGD